MAILQYLFACIERINYVVHLTLHLLHKVTEFEADFNK